MKINVLNFSNGIQNKTNGNQDRAYVNISFVLTLLQTVKLGTNIVNIKKKIINIGVRIKYF